MGVELSVGTELSGDYLARTKPLVVILLHLSIEMKLPGTVTISEDQQELSKLLIETILKHAKLSIKERGCFNIALSGGSLIGFLVNEQVNLLSSPLLDRWNVFLADERYVPQDDPESTFGEYQRRLPQLVERVQFHAPLMDTDMEVSAEEYSRRVRNVGRLDLIILGLGPDGHTASIFPPVSDSMLNTDKIIEAVYASPKPPPQRLTMTLPFIMQTRQILFVATGASKAPIIKRIPVDRALPPNALLQGNVHWFLDRLSVDSVQ